MPMVLALACAAGCGSKPEWRIGVVSAKLGSAGYAVTPAKNPGIAGPGILAVDCVDAARAGALDTLCVVTCDRSASCSSFAAGTWESYGTFQRGKTLLVHQVCGRPTGYALSFDCTAARAALDL